MGEETTVEQQLWNGDMYVGRSPDDWLEHMDGLFSVYTVLPDILDLWDLNESSRIKPGKK